MAKKRYSYVGVSLFLALLLPTPVFSDAPPHLIKQPFKNLESEENSTEGIGGQPQESSNKKPNQVQGINDPSSKKNSISGGGTEGGSKPAGTNNPSSGVLSNEATQNPTNKPSGGSSGTGQSSQVSPIVGGNNTSPSGRKNEATQNPTNKPSGEPSGTGQTSQPLPITGGNNTSPSGRNIDSEDRIPSPVENTLNSLYRNPFASLPWLFLLGLLGLPFWWFRRRRRQQQVNKFVDQIFEQKINNNIGFIINKIADKQEFKDYIDQYIAQQIDQTFQQKIRNNIPLMTHYIVNDNEELQHYIDQRLHYGVMNNALINSEIINFVTNSTAINNKINKVYRDIDIKISSIRSEWNQTFLILVGQYVDELIHIIGGKETFNILIANLISAKLDELLNQIMRTKNELIVIMNNADRNLYEWTLGELIAIKGCLTDREVLADQLISFSAELKTKLDCTPCVDINNFERFRPILIDHKQQEQIAGS
ncbi:hypothetical protein [Scytonema sp. PRP1]|uniref:hypothetical protein n=1 Tax=Scytonema sp. PRP1 TaxID=3120513 RepID=UPI002FD0696D